MKNAKIEQAAACRERARATWTLARRNRDRKLAVSARSVSEAELLDVDDKLKAFRKAMIKFHEAVRLRFRQRG